MWHNYCQRYTKRAIEHNRLVCTGGVKLAGLDRVSFDAIILAVAAITSTDNKSRLELIQPREPIRLPACLSVYLTATLMPNISKTN